MWPAGTEETDAPWLWINKKLGLEAEMEFNLRDASVLNQMLTAAQNVCSFKNLVALKLTEVYIDGIGNYLCSYFWKVSSIGKYSSPIADAWDAVYSHFADPGLASHKLSSFT